MRGFSSIILLLVIGAAYSQYGGGMDETKRAKICDAKRLPPSCNPGSMYRTFDGTCNNLNNPTWGAAFSDYQPWGQPWFGDSVSSFPKMSNGSDLASARVISKSLFGSNSVEDMGNTLAAIGFGQFVAHDMSFGVITQPKTCCFSGSLFFIPITCDAITIPPTDVSYSPQGWRCMEFTRNANEQDLQCKPVNGPVKQVSQTTAFLDLSNVYGDTVEIANNLRSFQNGQMKVAVRNGKEFPPQDPNAQTNCLMDDVNDPCYLSSDERLNTNPHLALVQVYFLREHNRIARTLQALNPHWNDEKLFQEARRINIAQYQQIVYYEYLPPILGRQYMIDNKLIYEPVTGSEQYPDYNPIINPAVLNLHANAASRVLHTMIAGQIQLMNEQRQVTSTMKLSDTFHKPKLYEQFFDDFGRGMVTQRAQAADKNIDKEVMEMLFKKRRPMGDDLKALDIQRGRDHGLPKYVDVRNMAGLPPATSWSSFLDVMSQADIDKLKTMYSSFTDVEAMVGMSLEAPVPGTLVGPSTRNVFKTQFLLSRISDRFFFETAGGPSKFNAPQMIQFRKASFARIFCNNANAVSTVQLRALRPVDPNMNPITDCANILAVNLKKWRDCNPLLLIAQQAPWWNNISAYANYYTCVFETM